MAGEGEGAPGERVLRLALVVSGLATITFALLADALGFGQPGGVGIGQLILGGFGGLLVGIGVWFRRFAQVYRGAAVFLLNTLILLAGIELAAIAVGRLLLFEEAARLEDLPYYRQQDWTDIYWTEARASERYRYEPYVIWRHLPFSGETVNFTGAGMRVTPGSTCEGDTFTVLTFGGSTMLGWGAPDWATIPAFLRSSLAASLQRPVCVLNIAEDGYVSTQSRVALEAWLQSSRTPDVVVFYDGVNDVLAAWESGRARAHVTLAKIAQRFEEEEPPLLRLVRGSRTFTLWSRWMPQPTPTPELAEPERRRLARKVVDAYLGNDRIVSNLASGHGFDYFLFWQPHIGIGGKTLTSDERSMLEGMDRGWLALARSVYSTIDSSIGGRSRIWSLTDALDTVEQQVWIDAAGHVTPEGNRIIADRMHAILRAELSNEAATRSGGND